MNFIVSSGELQKALETVYSIISTKRIELEDFQNSSKYKRFLEVVSNFESNKHYESDFSILDYFGGDFELLSIRKSESSFIKRNFYNSYSNDIITREREISKLKKLLRFLCKSRIVLIFNDARTYIKKMKANINYRSEEDNVELINFYQKLVLIPTYQIYESISSKK